MAHLLQGLFSRVVFPAPGDDMRFTACTPDSANLRPLSSAIRSFSESRFSRIEILVCPVSVYPSDRRRLARSFRS